MTTQSRSIRQTLLTGIINGTIALSMIPAIVTGDDRSQGVEAYQRGNYKEAFQYIQSSAKKGDTRAQYILGTMYRRGLGVPSDEYEGFFWCRQAAEDGLIEAQFQLGLMYLEGEGVTEDEEEAIEWLWAAADRGYPQATELLQFIFTREVEYGC